MENPASLPIRSVVKVRKTQIQKGGVGRRFFSFLPDARGFAAATGRGDEKDSDVA